MKKLKGSIECLPQSELIELIKEYSGYHKYEIQDILYFTAVAIAEIVASGRAVQFKGVGYFSPKQRNEYAFKNAFFDGDITVAKPKKSMSLAPDHFAKNLLNLPKEELELIINDKLKSKGESND